MNTLVLGILIGFVAGGISVYVLMLFFARIALDYDDMET